MAIKTPKTRNLQTWTEAKYWSAVRSALRKAFRYWKPLQEAKLRSRVKAVPTGGKRAVWHYKCAECNGLYREKAVQVDHIIPVGSLRCLEDLAPFLERLTVEYPSAFRVLCKECHQHFTNLESSEKRKTKDGQTWLFDGHGPQEK